MNEQNYLRCGNSYFKNGLCHCKISDNIVSDKCFCLKEYVEASIGGSDGTKN